MKIHIFFIAIFLYGFLHAQSSRLLSTNNWDLSSLYANEFEWEEERQIIQLKIQSINQFKDKVGLNATSLANALDAMSELRILAARMYLYGILLYETDVNSDYALSKYTYGTSIEAQVESAVSFIEYELSQLDTNELKEWILKEPRLQKYKIRINRVMNNKNHLLPPESQKIVESMSRWQQYSIDVYSQVIESDLGWPKIINGEGESIVIDPAEYFNLMRSSDQFSRKEGIRAYLEKLKSLENVYGLLLTRRIEADQTVAKFRNFENGIDALWFLRDGMPAGSSSIMTEVAKKNILTLHRYIELKKRLLGLEKMEYPDLNQNHLTDKHITLEESKEISVSSAKIFGSEYQSKLKERLNKPWYSLVPSEGKGGNFGIYPAVGDVPSYTVMSFNENLSSSRRLAGASALMMAFTNIAEINPPDTRDDPGIHSNAMIYVGYILHNDYLKNQTDNVVEQIAYMMQTLDLIARQFFKWAIISDFDQRLQEKILNGNTPTGSEISELYLQVLREYYGHDEGVLEIDEMFAYDWMNQGILFLSYENQFWPPAMAAALALLEKIYGGDEKVLEFFNSDYGLKESDRTFGMLKTIGIDMATEAPYYTLINQMNLLMDELEADILSVKN